MNVGQIATKPVVTVAPAAPLQRAAELMCDRHVGSVVVTESLRDAPVVVGMITDRDVVRAQLERTADLSRLCVADVMRRDPLVLREQDPIAQAIRELQARGVRRAPVISASGTLTGVVSADDLIAQVAQELATLAQLLSQQQRRETASRRPKGMRDTTRAP